MAVNPATVPTVPGRLAGVGLLRGALLVDAVVTGANGAAYLVAAGPLSDLFGLPAGGLRAVGAFLLVFAAAVWAVGASERPRSGAVAAIVVANAAWVLGSVAAVALDAGTPSTAGGVWMVLQAAVVAALAAAQTAGLRRRQPLPR